MKFVLTVKERVVLLGMLPQEGTLTMVRLIREAREGLSFSEEENAALRFQQAGERLKWRDDVPQEAEVELGPTVVGVIRERLGMLDKQEKLREDHLSLVEKFGYGGGG